MNAVLYAIAFAIPAATYYALKTATPYSMIGMEPGLFIFASFVAVRWIAFILELRGSPGLMQLVGFVVGVGIFVGWLAK